MLPLMSSHCKHSFLHSNCRRSLTFNTLSSMSSTAPLPESLLAKGKSTSTYKLWQAVHTPNPFNLNGARPGQTKALQLANDEGGQSSEPTHSPPFSPTLPHTHIHARESMLKTTIRQKATYFGISRATSLWLIHHTTVYFT